MSFASSRPLVHWRRRGPFKRQRAGQGRGHGRREEVCDVTVISSRGRWLIQWNPPEPAHHPGRPARVVLQRRERRKPCPGASKRCTREDTERIRSGIAGLPLPAGGGPRPPSSRPCASLSLSFFSHARLPPSFPSPTMNNAMLCYQ
jgi:hypothetical protein